MDTSKFLEIIRITLPVFALLGLGNVLSRAGKMTDSHQSFLNWIVYYISMPALIFVAMAAQPMRSLLQLDFIFGIVLAMSAIFIIYVLLSVVMRLDRRLAVIMIFSTYWSNCAYMGFPLTESAYGERGLLFAAIVNAVNMPIFVAITFVMIGVCSEKRQGIGKSLRDAFLNPIILASIAGILWSLAAGFLGVDGDGFGRLPIAVREGLGIGERVLRPVGTMGLSLALIAVGGKLRFRTFGKNVLPMCLAVAGKLLILPFVTLVLMRILWPSSAGDAVGAAVLLMTMPTAVTGAVIAAKFRLDEEFVSAVLALSMLCSVVMIPVWLYIVL